MTLPNSRKTMVISALASRNEATQFLFEKEIFAYALVSFTFPSFPYFPPFDLKNKTLTFDNSRNFNDGSFQARRFFSQYDTWLA